MIQIQQTIVGGHVHILSWNVGYSVNLKVFLRNLHGLNYIYKSTHQQAWLLHSEQE